MTRPPCQSRGLAAFPSPILGDTTWVGQAEGLGTLTIGFVATQLLCLLPGGSFLRFLSAALISHPHSCGHKDLERRFCGECLQPCLQVPSPLCPLCRMPFDPKKVEKASSVEKQLSSYKAPCRGCSKKVTLAKMRSHVSSCAKVQEQMANCPKFVPVVPTSQPIPSNIPNRSTFVCPYCGARNLDQQELVKHCMENHRNDPNKVVCPVCSAMPWGDPSYKSANFLQHLLHRHKFSYDTFVDYNIDEEAALQAALALSLSEN
ncbi:E3 ubiquitin-protein ligase RNF166 isoform X1 [Athene noctua]|uniref:E3 ubiquitin-protein ligase RNF166 isoform X1 n=1 Tax=Athene noctua TaxID=126797 RepID=UPI003EBC01E1